jgi:glycosyltransferase involved in cell wall biosynthesis
MITVAHVINALAIGGAETMLLKLLTHTDRTAFAPRVYTLQSPAGPILERVVRLGISVRELGMARGLPNPGRALRLARWLRQEPPDLVQTWMYHSDLVGGIAARLARFSMPVVWNIRNSTLDPSTCRRRTLGVVRACARLSASLPDAVICCSRAAGGIHAALGYDASKLHVIPNGFDVTMFRPDRDRARALRRALRIAEPAAVIGLVARFDPQKDHRTFVEAAGRLHAEMPQVRFVLCGRDVDEANAQLMTWIAEAGISAVCFVLGERSDMPDVNAALDIATSASCYGEAFPNAIGEAMACGVPCVVTDVGDSGYLVGDTGRVVPRLSAHALCAAWKDLLELSVREREQLGQQARQRIAACFSIETVARSYEEVYRCVLDRRARNMPRQFLDSTEQDAEQVTR